MNASHTFIRKNARNISSLYFILARILNDETNLSQI